MMQRWDRHRRSFYASEKFFHRGQRGTAKLAGHRLGLRGVTIHHRNQFHACALFLQLVVNPGVVAAKRAHTNDCNANWTFVSQPLIFSEVGQSSKGYHEGVWRSLSDGTRLWVHKLDHCPGYWSLYLHAPDAGRDVRRQQQSGRNSRFDWREK